MSSKSQKENQKKKERSSPLALNDRSLSPSAATLYHTAINPPLGSKQYSPPMPVPPPRDPSPQARKQHSPPILIPSPNVPSPEARLHGLGISVPTPMRRTQSLDNFMIRPQTPSLEERTRHPREEVVDLASLPSLERSKPRPQKEVEEFQSSLGGGYMYPALKNYMKRSRKKFKKKSKKKSKRKSKKKSKKNSKKKSKKATRRR